MEWYYAHNGQQQGPVEEATLTQLVNSGTITRETLVWKEGMPNWLPYGQTIGAGDGSSELVSCPTCGAQVSPHELIPFGQRTVCPHCRDRNIQQMHEGADDLEIDGEFAGFWPRFGALFLDGIILTIVQVIKNVAIGLPALDLEGTGPDTLNLAIASMVLDLLIGLAYAVFFLGNPKTQATPGMMALKLQIVSGFGTKVSYMRALGRYFASILTQFTFGIGYLIMIWDEEKRTLHDRIANTRVIKKF